MSGIVWKGLVPFISIALLIALLAAGKIFRSTPLIYIVGALSIAFALVQVFTGVMERQGLIVAVYLGFAALYLFVAVSLRRHLHGPSRDPLVPMSHGEPID